ncbi:MAG TPA: hypothetical protein VI757_02980 [Bacteroidia bacterium]|nr:hypothetical protein [Bacteroidia bacterium]
MKEALSQRLIEAAKRHKGKIKELGLALEEVVNAKISSVRKQRYEESSMLKDKEIALVKELESLLNK